MRGRPARRIQLSSEDAAELQRLVRDGRTEQRVARRARILLAMASPSTVVEQLAAHVEQRRETIWHLCRRYEKMGLEAIEDAPREGRPRIFSPSAACRDRDARLLRARRSGLAHDALVDAQPGQSGGRARPGAEDSSLDCVADPASGRPST